MAMSPQENQRQRALDTYHIVDSLPEAAYDDIARLAAMLCGAPIALVSLLDRDRQWFKANVGFTHAQTAREHAVCDHAIREPDRLFEVNDLRADARFADNPLVAGDDGARFYAGMPLVTPHGAAVGTVCVLDTRPRTLDEPQREALASLARLTMNLMEFRRREREREVADAITLPTASASVEAETAVCVLELQNHAALVRWHGERAVERLLAELDGLIGAGLAAGDSTNRVTGSTEFVIALHSAGIDGALARIERLVADFCARHEVVVLSGVARAATPDESPTTTYLRAEDALSQAKDAWHATHPAAPIG